MRTKNAIVDTILRRLGHDGYGATTGSTGRKDALVAIAQRFDLDIDVHLSKPKLAKAVVEASGRSWLPTHDSRGSSSGGGSTVTREGWLEVERALQVLLRQDDQASPAPVDVAVQSNAVAADGDGSFSAGQARIASPQRGNPQQGQGVSVPATSLEIRPGVGVLALFPAMNYKPWYALGEFVDNALASYQHDLTRLRELEGDDFSLAVEIEIDRADLPRMTIRDNAGGIPSHLYAAAFQTARPPEERTANALRQFGVGMKSAACWFANEWRVRTTALGEEVERTISFDVPRIVRDGVERLDPVESPAPPEAHYTVLELWNLNRVPHGTTVHKIKRHLSSMYRQFTRDGRMTLTFDGEPLRYEEPAVLETSPHNAPDGEPEYWRIDLDFSTESGMHATGFAALRQRGNAREAGLAIFKDGRLIVGSDDESYRPQQIFGSPNSFRYQRVFGEINLEGVGLTHSKDAFQWDGREDEFIEALHAAMSEGEVSLLEQAEQYRARQAEHQTVTAAHKAVEDTATELQTTAQRVVDTHSREEWTHDIEDDKAHPDDIVADFHREFKLTVLDQTWEVSLSLLNDPAVDQWVKLADSSWSDPTQDPRQVRIAVNLAHDFIRRFVSARGSELDLVVRMGAALMLAEATSRQGADGNGAVIMRKRTNDILSALANQEILS